MQRKEFFTMTIEGLDESEAKYMQEGITYPALMTLNSSFKLRNKSFRKALFKQVSIACDEQGMMPFFVNPLLHEKYPPDLECTALFVAGAILNNEPVTTDLDAIKKKMMSNGFFETWLKRTNQPIDYTSQLMMCICYGCAGLVVEETLEKTFNEKCADFASLYASDAYYSNPLYFIYFSLYVKDKGVYPNAYKSLVEKFIETYSPADEIEASMLQKICTKMRLPTAIQKITRRMEPIFTNGRRKWVKYHSSALKEVFKSSANLCRAYGFDRTKF